MSEYDCSICNEIKHCSELEVRKVNGIECVVCESCCQSHDERGIENE